MGEIIGILRRTLPIQDFSVLLSLDFRTPLSPSQVIEIIRNAKSTIDNQIKEIHKEIAEAESLSIFQPGDKQVLNEEGLPIRDIREDVFDEEDGRRAVLAEEEPTRIFTMDEIDRMMDEAEADLARRYISDHREAEEQAELQQQREKGSIEEGNEKKKEEGGVTAVAGQGLEVGQVSGEELLAKLMDDNKNRYNPVDGTWAEDEGDMEGGNDDEDEEDEGEDEYGRTRGFLVPPYLAKGSIQEKGVKFASFEKPATPSSGTLNKPVKSALKKSTAAPSVSRSATKPSPTPTMSTTVTERAPK